MLDSDDIRHALQSQAENTTAHQRLVLAMATQIASSALAAGDKMANDAIVNDSVKIAEGIIKKVRSLK